MTPNHRSDATSMPATSATSGGGSATTDAVPLGEVVAALAAGTPLLSGQYRVEPATDTWWWSDAVYRMHGYDPKEVTPGLRLLRSGQRSEDGGQMAREAAASLRSGRPFTSAQRIVDAQGRPRTLLVSGQAARSGHSPAIVGHMVDVTPLQREAVQRASRRVVDSTLASTAVIEQAKGVLMAVHGVDSHEAMTMLVAHTSAAGVDLPTMSAHLMEGLSGTGRIGGSAESRVRRVVGSVQPTARRPRAKDPLLTRRAA